jgi:putative hemolysin
MNDGIAWSSLPTVGLWFLILIALNAFFVAGEYSLILSRRTRMTTLAENGSAAAKTVLRAMNDQEAFLSAVQIGITLTAVATGALTEKPLTDMFVSIFNRFDVPLLRAAATGIGTMISLSIASFLSIIFGELVPRSLTLRAAERIALVCVPPLTVLGRVLRPVVWLLKRVSSLVLRLFGVKGGVAESRLHSADELRMLVEESERGGMIESAQSEMLDKVFDLGATTVREVMVPRTEMVCVEVETPLAQCARIFSRQAYSRVPVYADSIDNIVGVLHSKDMMRALLIADRTRQPTIRQMMREPMFVPDSQKADELLRDFRKRKYYLALVLDEFGGTAGLITLSDLVTRIIGDVQDAHEPTAPDIEHHADGSAIINGLTTLGDFNDAFGTELVDKNYDTIGGFVMGQLGRIPRLGDAVSVPGSRLQLRVDQMDRLRVAKLRLISSATGHA